MISKSLAAYANNHPLAILTPSDHISTGGEGAVYLKGETIYKIYHDPDKAISNGIEKKIERLSQIRETGIVAPQGMVRNKEGKVIGIFMPRCVADPLCKAFTNTWRHENGMDFSKTVLLTNSMRSTVIAAHRNNAVMVDANETNWLMKDSSTAFVIDVDSWQLPGFHATAIMPSIRDYSCDEFTPNTDWFSWAVVSFQLWTGIHPYRGTHPSFARSDLERRMREGVSIFDAKVKLPPAARPVSDIPSDLRDWYMSVFNHSHRGLPPAACATTSNPNTPVTHRTVHSASCKITLSKVCATRGKLIGLRGGMAITLEDATYQVSKLCEGLPAYHLEKESAVAILEQRAAIKTVTGDLFLIWTDTSTVTVRSLTNSTLTSKLILNCSRLWEADNRIFAVVNSISNGLIEVAPTNAVGNLPATIKRAWPVASLSTKFFDGVFLQDCLGVPFLGVPHQGGITQSRAGFLKDYWVSSGYARDVDNVFLSATRKSDGALFLLHITGSQSSGFHVLSEYPKDTYEGINAASTAAGVTVVEYNDDLIVCKGKHSKVITGPFFTGPHTLIELAGGIGLITGNTIYKMSLA